MNKSKVENGEVIEEFRKKFPSIQPLGYHKCDGWNDDDSLELDTQRWDWSPVEAFITNALNQEHDKAYEEGARNQALLDADALNQQRIQTIRDIRKWTKGKVVTKDKLREFLTKFEKEE